MSRPIITCRDCNNTRPHHARGLCNTCYRRHSDRGTIHDIPRNSRPWSDTYEDWLFLHADGYTRRQAAERLGITRDALDKAIKAAREPCGRLLHTAGVRV